MTKRQKWYWGSGSLLALALVVIGAAVLLKHEPSFYRQALAAKGTGSKELSQRFLGQSISLGTAFKEGKGPWDYTFTQEQINSFFEEDFISLGEAEALRKHDVYEPRLVLEDNKLRVAFRYGSGFMATVISYDLKVWLVPKEVNTIAIEILAKRVGAIPVSSQGLLDGISDVVRTQGVEVAWYRHDNNPVAIVRFAPDRSNRTGQLLRLTVDARGIAIAGRSGGDVAAQVDVSSPTALAALPLALRPLD